MTFQTVDFTFSLQTTNVLFQYDGDYVVKIDNLFSTKDSTTNSFFVWLMYKFVNGTYIRIAKKRVSSNILQNDFEVRDNTYQYIYPGDNVLIKGFAGSGTVTGYTCATNKGPLKSANNKSCASTSIDNCLGSYETDAASSTFYRCKLDGQNCVKDETNVVTKFTSPDIDLYCSNNAPTLDLSTGVSRCDKGKGKSDYSSLELTNDCTTLATNCSDYYTGTGTADSPYYRCKMTKDSNGTFACKSNLQNRVTITNGNACSDKQVFVDANDLQNSVNTLFDGTPTATTETAQNELYGNIENWDISNVDNLSNLFKDKNISNININNITNWDTRNIKYADNMFYNSIISSSNVLDISNWKMSNVTNCYNFNIGARNILKKGFKKFSIDIFSENIKIILDSSTNEKNTNKKISEIKKLEFIGSSYLITNSDNTISTISAGGYGQDYGIYKIDVKSNGNNFDVFITTTDDQEHKLDNFNKSWVTMDNFVAKTKFTKAEVNSSDGRNYYLILSNDSTYNLTYEKRIALKSYSQIKLPKDMSNCKIPFLGGNYIQASRI